MTTNDARELLVSLLEAELQKDEELVASYNLPASSMFLLRKLAGISQELASLQKLLARREQEEGMVEQALQAELERLP